MRTIHNRNGSVAKVGSRRAASTLVNIFLQEDINFLVTNRIPRRYATLLIGWFSRIRSRRLTRLSVAAWNLFDDLRLDDAKTHDFVSLRDCFVRELRPGVRCVDPDPHVVTSPCDAVIGAFGDLQADRAIQAKGFPYSVGDLLGDERIVDRHRGGKFVTLRLRASMYHRFHAPCDGRVRRVRYISGDTWNVNPIALKRIENLFCKNERAVLPFELPTSDLYFDARSRCRHPRGEHPAALHSRSAQSQLPRRHGNRVRRAVRQRPGTRLLRNRLYHCDVRFARL